MKTEEEKNILNESLENADTVTSDSDFRTDPVLEYEDIVNDIDPTNTDISGNNTATVNLTTNYKIQLFQEKISHFQTINNNDFLGFTLVFGNSSSRAYEPGNGAPATLTDELDLSDLDSNIKLTLVDLCMPNCYRLVRNTNTPIDPCSTSTNNIFIGGTTYTLTLQKCKDCSCTKYCYFPWKCIEKKCNEWTSVFSIPCQSICCISMLFRIDPTTPCNCDEDCCLEN